MGGSAGLGLHPPASVPPDPATRLSGWPHWVTIPPKLQFHAGHGSGSEFFSTVLDLASALSARLVDSGVRPSVDFPSQWTFLWLCNSLGIVVNWERSQLVNKLLSIGSLFLSCVDLPAFLS